jgi:hypothetical protein
MLANLIFLPAAFQRPLGVPHTHQDTAPGAEARRACGGLHVLCFDMYKECPGPPEGRRNPDLAEALFWAVLPVAETYKSTLLQNW